jgi:hypothetical protein
VKTGFQKIKIENWVRYKGISTGSPPKIAQKL